jgi:3-oxoacyl-[acyl-carrier-protein] synthase I
MMKSVYVNAHNIISASGITSEENFASVLKGYSGVQLQHRNDIDDEPFYASLIDEKLLQKVSVDVNNKDYTRFETLLIASVEQALKNSAIDIRDEKTILIFSSTKGNVELLENQDVTPELTEQISLFHSATLVTEYFKNPNTPVVISNACISGIAALLFAKRILQSGRFEHAVVVGADTISKFIFSGFKSFRALSNGKCKPFSIDRDGINLGEAAATVILTTIKSSNNIQLKGGATGNDANHISGPSKTGDELSRAINIALTEANILPEEIDFISAHGTATLFNDEMEAKAFVSSGLNDIPVNSLKGFFGHTLGAAGLVESVISLMSVEKNVIIPTLGFTSPGIPVAINICTQPIYKPLKSFLKTASGFGGCNGALVFSKVN